jgi:hypothetical protein
VGSDAPNTQNFEVEAMYEGTAFAILMARKDKRLMDFIRQQQDVSPLARRYAYDIDALEQSPRALELDVISDYADTPSLDGVASAQLQNSALAITEVEKHLSKNPFPLKPPTVQETTAAKQAFTESGGIDAWLSTTHSQRDYTIILALLRKDHKTIEAGYKNLQKSWTQTQDGMDKFWKENCGSKPKEPIMVTK